MATLVGQRSRAAQVRAALADYWGMSKDAIDFATRNTLPVIERRPMTPSEAGAAILMLAFLGKEATIQA